MSDPYEKRGPAPFDLTFSPALPELLRKLDISLVISTYQAGKLIFLSPQDDVKLVQLPRTFPRAMAIGIHGHRLAIATAGSVEILAHDSRLAAGYPRKPDTYDTIYLPRASYHTGRIDCHGLEWGNIGLWVINTRFSALCSLSEEYGFIPRWKPSFISELVPGDRCHLNGMAMENGSPRYVTCLCTGNTYESWKQTIPDGGVVIDVPSGEIIARDLAMPHSPRLVQGDLFLLLSSTGDLIRLDTEAGKSEVVQRLNGFVRGMAYHRDHLFVAMSKIRKNSSSFRKLKIADTSNRAGITVVHVPTGTVVGRLTYDQSVDEIFDVSVLPGLHRPGIINQTIPIHRHAFSFPEGALWAVRKESEREDFHHEYPENPYQDYRNRNERD